MRTHTTLARTLAVALTALGASACGDAAQPVAPVVPPAVSLAKGGPNALPTNGRIYFTSDFAGNMEVYSMKPDGSDRRRLTYTDDYDEHLDVSWDGKKLVTASEDIDSGNLYTMNVDGTNRRLVVSLTESRVFYPAWSPDGRSIAYVALSTSGDVAAIWTVTASGGKATQLTSPTQEAAWPSWSPDGKRIVFAAHPVGSDDMGLYVVNADGSGPQLLYDCAALCADPVWSPDGARIVYVAHTGGVAQVQKCVMQQAGFQCGFPLATDVSTFAFDISPDGSQLVFMSQNQSAEHVATANVNGSAQTLVTGDLRNVSDVAWGR